MMILSEFIKRAGKLLTDNSPAILTGISVAGTVTTAYLTGLATFRAAELINEYNQELDVSDLYMPAKDKVKLTWRLYIPAAGTGLLTVTCIILVNRIGTRRVAAMTAAYSLAEKAFEQYQEKVIEKIGSQKEEQVRAEITQERVSAKPPSSNELMIIGHGDVLCFEAYTGRYFSSNVEALRKAENRINYRLIHDHYISLSEFYDLIDLAHTSVSDDIGWNLDKQLELKFTGVLTPDGRPCVSIEYHTVPLRGYDRIQ